ncbi:MAG: MMPL family transporter [Pseudomonadales bacterium]|nr:MMPL family transporter [Pseudomonadales bacterium]
MTFLLVYQVEHVTFDTSIESFLDKDSDVRQGYIQFQADYGVSEYLIVLITEDDLFSQAAITRIQALEDDINANVINIAGTESISSSTYIYSDNEDLVIDSFFPDNLSAVDFIDKRKTALQSPHYANRLISSDGNTTAIFVRLAFMVKDEFTGEFRPIKLPNMKEILSDLRKVVAAHQDNFSHALVIGGAPTATLELTRATRKDILVFSTLAIIVVSLVLFIVFRRLSAVILPVLSLFLAINITMSVMILGEFPMQVTSSILPSFLLAVCVGDAIHLLQSFYGRINAGFSRSDSVSYAIRHTCVAMFFTTLTTSVGLLSFSTSDIAPIASFGLFAAFGVWVALILTLICLPSILLLMPIKARPNRELSQPKQLALVTAYVDFIERNQIVIFCSSLLVFAVSIVCALQLTFSHNALDWFEDKNPVKQSILQIDDKLSGTMQVEVLLSTPDNKPFTPVQLTAIDGWLQQLDNHVFAGIKISSVTSILNLLKESNRVLTASEAFTLPDTPASLAQQVLLLQLDAADLVTSRINADFSEMRITLATPWRDAVEYTAFLEQLRASFDDDFAGVFDIKITGMAAIANKTFSLMLESMAVSYVIAALVVSMVMIILLNNLKLGASLMLPNILPIFLVLAVMYIFSMPLDLFTMVIGSIAIGLIVDDSVHFNYTFLRAKSSGKDTREALIDSIVTTGRALLTTTVILCSTFLVYTVSDMKNLQTFGVLTALCIAFALIADFLLAPAMIFILYKKK